MSKIATLTNYVDSNDNVRKADLRIYKSNRLDFSRSFVNDGTMDVDSLTDEIINICTAYGVKQIQSKKVDISI